MRPLQVGVGALTFQQQRSHFSIWAIMKSPLMLGTDLLSMSKDQLDLVAAPEVLAVNQDPLGVPGDLVWKEGPAEVLSTFSLLTVLLMQLLFRRMVCAILQKALLNTNVHGSLSTHRTRPEGAIEETLSGPLPIGAMQFAVSNCL